MCPMTGDSGSAKQHRLQTGNKSPSGGQSLVGDKLRMWKDPTQDPESTQLQCTLLGAGDRQILPR